MSTNFVTPAVLATAGTQPINANSFNFQDFTYPIDLGAIPELNHYVIFYINEPIRTQYSFNPKALPGGTKTKNPIAAAVNASGGINPQSQLNQNVAASQAAGNAQGNSSTFTANNSQNTTKTKMAICLYMPPNIVTNYGANWNEEDLGFGGNAAQAVGEGWAKMHAGDTTGLFQDLGGSGIVKALFQSLGTNLIQGIDAITSLNLTGVASSNLRVAFNPHQEVLFRGIRFRVFQFDFQFTPRSEDEAILTDNIIQAFKFYAAPEINQGLAGPFFIYPAEFDIQFWSNGKPNDFLNKISTCALTNITVNYTANGMFTSFKPTKSPQINGVTVQTNLSLQFMELELMTKERILAGF